MRHVDSPPNYLITFDYCLGLTRFYLCVDSNVLYIFFKLGNLWVTLIEFWLKDSISVFSFHIIWRCYASRE